MGLAPPPRERLVTIIARDPALRIGKRIVRAQVPIPSEALAPGPVGYRVEVIDYDASNDMLYLPRPLPPGDDDPFETYTDKQLLDDPRFHRQNVYAIVMRTLARFEFALGRRVELGVRRPSAQGRAARVRRRQRVLLRDDHALLFGYFPERRASTGLHLPLARRRRARDHARARSTACARATPTLLARPGGLSRGLRRRRRAAVGLLAASMCRS